MTESPCVNICRIREDGKCVGCLRSLDEIAEWSRLTDAEKQAIVQRVNGEMFPG